MSEAKEATLRQLPQMEAAVAIQAESLSKSYILYESRLDQALGAMGLNAIKFWARPSGRKFFALNDLSFTVRHGERVGLIGRNGAGKTTLLKLITGVFPPTSGNLFVNGTVQALMQVGLGFHPEMTGVENINGALIYNGLNQAETNEAVQDIIEFVELGDFLHQPFKTYSMGMRSRLQFAVATAVNPDILVIDEVLSAGDAYFAAKSAERIKLLAKSGCTLLIVSHSAGQILEFCDRAIWINEGQIVDDGRPLDVVKEYEAYIHRLRRGKTGDSSGPPEAGEAIRNRKRQEFVARAIVGNGDEGDGRGEGASKISRWSGTGGLHIAKVRILDRNGHETSTFDSGSPFEVEFDIEAKESGRYPCSYAFVMFAQDGRQLIRHLSDQFIYDLDAGEHRLIRMRYDSLQLGPGDYFFSVAIYKTWESYRPELCEWYDLISRSFEFKVQKDSLNDPSVFRHPVTWLEPEQIFSAPAADSRK